MSVADTGTFASLAVRDFRLVWWAGTFTFIALGIGNTARAWLAVELTDSNTALGAVSGAFALGLIIFTPLGGVAADRLPKRALLIATHVVFASVGLTVGFMVVLDLIEFWMLLVAGFCQGAGFALAGPVRIAIMSEMIDTELLPNALALSQLTLSGTMVFGPALAGLLGSIDGIGIGGAYLIAGSLMALGVLPVLRLPKVPRRGASDRSPFRELADGFSYVRGKTDVKALVLITLLIVFGAFAYTSFIPRIVEDTFGKGVGWLGALLAFHAVGGLVASFLVAGARGEERLRSMRLIGPFLASLALLGLAVTPSIWTTIPVLFLMGFAATGFQTLNMAATLMRSDAVFHGRVQSLLMLTFSATGVAAVLLGGLADAIGLRSVFGVMAGFTICTAVLAVLTDRRYLRL